MKTHVSPRARPACFVVLLILVAITVAMSPGWECSARAQNEGPVIVRVEEDWELVLLTPDPVNTAPQVTCAVSPIGDLSSVYATFELNHQSQPGFATGGLHLQLWRDETSLVSRHSPQLEVMSTVAERVRWTQAMTLEAGGLTFEILNGDSTTWGSFGGEGYLKASVSTDLPNLNQYDPRVSVANSGAGYAGNRVHALTLTAVRVVTSTGEVYQDDTDRPAHTLD
jgi:hypothetical protein